MVAASSLAAGRAAGSGAAGERCVAPLKSSLKKAPAVDAPPTCVERGGSSSSSSRAAARARRHVQALKLSVMFLLAQQQQQQQQQRHSEHVQSEYPEEETLRLEAAALGWRLESPVAPAARSSASTVTAGGETGKTAGHEQQAAADAAAAAPPAARQQQGVQLHDAAAVELQKAGGNAGTRGQPQADSAGGAARLG
ncbi:hypothetical protein COO60DRAFT_1650418 [Scenedesmus sp. NREL 46B-D3]|nr:hypothetical protein COO60DRAFT_1650418 [Scenedesmus sp. NREL 46B-D3]